jgi:hypothetical protein
MRRRIIIIIKAASSDERALAPVPSTLGGFRKAEHGWEMYI